MSPSMLRAALAAFALPIGLFAAAEPAPKAATQAVTRAEVLQAIKVFDAGAVSSLAAPAPAAGDATAAVASASNTIYTYALDSDDVVIDLLSDAVPWCNLKKGVADATYPGERGLLFAAYLAGEIQAQLHSGKTDSNPYAGWVHMFRVYRSMKTREGIQFPEIEALMAHQADGTLASFAIETEKRSLAHLRNAYGATGTPNGPGSESTALASARQN